jgi:CheY-like chemotaxis protein
MIAYTASDLLWSSRIKSTADALGVQARRISKPDDLEALLDAGQVRLVLVDLEAEDAQAMISALRGPDASESARKTPTLAWAPHVLVDDLENARRAGIDRVLTRGAFAANLETILAETSAKS